MNVVIGIQPDDDPARLKATLDSISLQLGESGRVVRISTEIRGGAARLNWLMSHSDEPVAVLLESGCVVGPCSLELLCNALASSPRAGLAGPSTNRAWNEQNVFAGAGGSPTEVAATAVEAARRFGDAVRTLAPLYSLGEFCYAIRRDVCEKVGPADEGYRSGPMWEKGYNLRAARLGFAGLWVCGAYVWRAEQSAQHAREELAAFEASRRRYQDELCGVRLRGEKTTYRPRCRGDACPNFAPRTIEIAAPDAAPSDPDLVSCIMPTRDRRAFIPAALQCFLAQDHPRLELVVVDDGDDPIADLLPDDPRVRYIRSQRHLSVGEKRNLACAEARGAFIAHWDDDDWYAPSRVSRQIADLRKGADLSGSSAIHFYDRANDEAWLYTFRGRPWVAGTTLAYRRDWWRRHPFPDRYVGEDNDFIWKDRSARIADLSDPRLCVAAIHAGNVSPKRPHGPFWSRVPAARVHAIMGTLTNERLPLVSCLLLTKDRRAFIPLALACYDSQSYPNRELLVVDDGADPVEDLVRDHPHVRYLRVPKMNLGRKRNAACAAARGELLAFWDDDDWYSPLRLERQVDPILRGSADITGLRVHYLLELPKRAFWTASDALHQQMFLCDVAGGTTVLPRSLVGKSLRYPERSVGEDGAFLAQATRAGRRVQRIDEPLFVYVRHGQNTWSFNARTHGREDDWRELERPADFSTEMLERYAAAAEAHARNRNR